MLDTASQVSLEEAINEIFIGQSLQNVEFYNVNDNYLEFDPEGEWVLDGGVQLKTEVGQFCLGWSNKMQGYSFSDTLLMSDLLGDLSFYEIGAKDVDGIRRMIGCDIVGITYEWQSFELYDEDAQLLEEKSYFPVNLTLKFSNNQVLRVALVQFEVSKEKKMVNTSYDLHGEILIHLHDDLKVMVLE